MKVTKVLAGIALMAVAGATTGRADMKDFAYRCSPGAIRTCASIRITTTLNGSGGTDVTILVRNLQGSSLPFIPDNTGGSFITRIGIVAPSITGASGLAVTHINGATKTGFPASRWFLRTPGGLGGPVELTAGVLPSGSNGGITGCATSGSVSQPNYFTTCAPGAWVQFTFSTTNAWSANNAEIAWLVRDVRNDPLNAIECGTNDSNGAREHCTMVTPEPVTMLLLGSGLAGMGGFGLVRRRKSSDEIV